MKYVIGIILAAVLMVSLITQDCLAEYTFDGQIDPEALLEWCIFKVDSSMARARIHAVIQNPQHKEEGSIRFVAVIFHTSKCRAVLKYYAYVVDDKLVVFGLHKGHYEEISSVELSIKEKMELRRDLNQAEESLQGVVIDCCKRLLGVEIHKLMRCY